MPKANLKGQKLTLSKVAKEFSDEAKAWQCMEQIRWPNGPICPHCGTTSAYFLQPKADRYTRTGHASARRVWKCAGCRKQFSVLIGTIFEDSRIPLSKWLLALYLMCSGKNGVSAHELHRELEITYKSAWFMAHRIRYAMEQQPLASKLSGIVEADETYIGGREPGKRGRPGAASKKTPVVLLVERNGEARSRAVARVDRETLRQALDEHVADEAHLMTDDLGPYRTLGTRFAKHETVFHGVKEYARGNVHINTAEGYFSQLKRSIDGTHHHVSRQHLHRYLSEFDLRYNTRKEQDGQRMVRVVKMAAGKRLRYRRPVELPEA